MPTFILLIYAILCHSRSNILVPIDRWWHLFLMHSLSVNPWDHSNAHTLWGFKMRQRAKFCADRSNRCGDMAVFRFSRWRPCAILDFQKLEILTAHTLRRAKVRQHAKFYADRSNRCGDTAVFKFSRWRPSAILDLLYACLDHPRSVFWWSLSLCKIWFESVQ